MESCHRPHLLLLLLVTASILASPAVTALSPSPPPRPTPLFVLGDHTATCGDSIIERIYNFISCRGSRDRVPDLIADRMGLRPLTRFLLGLGLTGADIANGINFAVLRSPIISGGGDYTNGLDRLLSPSSLSRQVEHVQQALQRLYFEEGPTKAHRVLSSAVFVLSFGTDDYVDLFQSGGPRGVRIKYGRRGMARVLVEQMEQAVKSLYNGGVRKIACMGVGPLGCAPRTMWQGQETMEEGRDCIDEANEVVSDYNARLSHRLVILQKELPELQIVFCDIYQGIMEIISNPLTYGFKDVKNACCGLGHYGGMIGCMFPNLACNDSSSHVWWDSYSTTKEVNTLLANWSWLPPDPQLQICKPITLHQLAV